MSRENQCSRNFWKIYEPRIFEFLSDTMSFGVGLFEAIGFSVICLSESITFYSDHSQNLWSRKKCSLRQTRNLFVEVNICIRENSDGFLSLCVRKRDSWFTEEIENHIISTKALRGHSQRTFGRTLGRGVCGIRTFHCYSTIILFLYPDLGWRAV